MRNFKRLRKIVDFLSVALKSPAARLELGLLFGLIMNLLYVTVNLISAFLYHSLWALAVAFYQALFMSLRAYLFSSRSLYTGGDGTSSHSVRRASLKAGVILLVSDLFASLMMLYSILTERRVVYSGFLLFVFLTYTVYSLFSSLIGMKKWHNDNKPLHFAARNLTFSASLMSFFNLQYSLFQALGVGREGIRRMNVLIGIVILTLIIILPTQLILKSLKPTADKSQNS